ncbi:MAG: HIRAN domain-containing protein [Amphiplicatus sp.]
MLIFAGLAVMAFMAALAYGARRGRGVAMTGDGSFDTEVVGESHYQDALDAICGGKCEDGHELCIEAVLAHEPQNRHDRNAVAVLIEGRKVGHLSRPDAKKFRQRGLSSVQTQAMVVGGWRRRNGDEGHYGVRLDFPV